MINLSIIEDEPLQASLMDSEMLASSLSTEIIKGLDGEDGKDGEKGENGADGRNGKDGYTPIKGIDYFDGKDGLNGKDGKDGYTPRKGIDYFDGAKGEKGDDGYTPRKGVDYFDGKDGADGKDYEITESDYEAIANITKDKVDLSEYVKNTDYPTSDKGGVIRTSGTYGISASSNGYLQATIKNVTQYDSMSNNGIIGKGTLENVLADKGYITEETDPTVPSWAKEENKPTYTAEEVGALPNDTVIPQPRAFTISYEHFTVVNNATKGVAPYSTSYGSADITIDKEWAEETGFDWVEGALYNFIIDETIGSSTYRNGRIRIGEDGDWKPIFGYNSAYEAVYSYLIKAQTFLYQYKSNVIADGCLCREYDANTTYAYLVNTIPTGNITIDANGYGARYSLVFPTTSLSELNEEKWSSIVASSATGTTKKKVNAPKLYIDRLPLYIYSANITAGSVSANALYEHYATHDVRYLVNTSATYCSINKRLFLYLHNFNPEDLSFEPDATVGNVLTPDKFATKFPKTMEGDVYLYFLGWNSSTWYTCSPNFTQANKLFKYTPSTGEFHDTNILVG